MGGFHCRTTADCPRNVSARAGVRRTLRAIATLLRGDPMRPMHKLWMIAVLLMGATVAAAAPSDADTRATVDLFKHAGESSAYFHDCYGYAVFPTIGKGAFIVGGAHGTGRVYARGKYIGDA